MEIQDCKEAVTLTFSSAQTERLTTEIAPKAPAVDFAKPGDSKAESAACARAADIKRSSPSMARIEANRRNARRSTGPRTARGKANSRRNALKHGFLAKELLIAGGEGKESSAEFAQLLQGLTDYFQPEGLPEELLVEQIAAAYWRLRRLHQHEVGEIRRRLDDAPTAVTNEKLQRLKQCQSTLALQRALNTLGSDVPLLRGMAPVELEGIRQEFLTSTQGIDFLLQLLAGAREEIATTGTASADLLRQLYLYFGCVESGLARYCDLRSDQACKPHHSLPAGEDISLSSATSQTEMLARIDTEKNGLLLRRAAVATMEESARVARVNSYRLPDPAALERIVHYESHLQRQLSRAYAHLERLQRLRAGEDLPLPLSARLELG